MHYSEIDYDKIAAFLEKEGYERRTPSEREACILHVKEAFRDGRMVAGVAHSSARVGCVMGQIEDLLGSARWKGGLLCFGRVAPWRMGFS